MPSKIYATVRPILEIAPLKDTRVTTKMMAYMAKRLKMFHFLKKELPANLEIENVYQDCLVS